MKEFEIISKLITPIASSYDGALGLADDVAVIAKDDETDYVITTDSMAEDVHFSADQPAESIAHKLLCSNLSDIASAGSKPLFYTLNGTINGKTSNNWLKAFTGKLGELNKMFDIHLIGGDTIAVKDKLLFSITAIGEVAKGQALLRKSAKVEDDIYVSGDLGRSYFGYQIYNNQDNLGYQAKDEFLNHYLYPRPKICLGLEISKIANACTDVSDGFLADLNNVCKASDASAIIELDKVPLALQGIEINKQVSWGEDYELIFTAKKTHRAEIERLAKKLNNKISRVGKIIKNSNGLSEINIYNASGVKIEFEKFGYEHLSEFSG